MMRDLGTLPGDVNSVGLGMNDRGATPTVLFGLTRGLYTFS